MDPNPILNIFHFPEVENQQFILLLESSARVQQSWPSISQKVSQLAFNQPSTRVIQYSEQATLLNLDQQLSGIQDFGNEKPNPASAIRAVAQLVQESILQKNLKVLMVASSIFDNERVAYVKQQISRVTFPSDTKVQFHVLVIGQSANLDIYQQVQAKFGDNNNKALLTQLQTSINSKDYDSTLNRQFERINNLFTKDYKQVYDLKAFPWVAKSIQLNYINQPYVLSPSETITVDGKQVIQVEWSVDLVEGFSQFLYNQYRLAQLIGHRPALQNGVAKILDLSVYQEQEAYYPALDKLNKLEMKDFVAKNTECSARERGAINLDQIMQHGLTKQAFIQSAKDLLALGLDTKVDPDSSAQDRSVVNFINQKDIIVDEDYKNVLKNISEGGEAAEIIKAVKFYPIVGQGILLNRAIPHTQASLITLVAAPTVHPVFDSASFYNTNSGQYKINLSDGYGHEVVNCVLPLYGTEDADLQDFIRSKFFDAIFNFQTFKSGDIASPETLAHILALYDHHISKMSLSQWRDAQSEIIQHTFKMKYADYEPFKKLKQQLLQNPYDAVVSPFKAFNINPNLSFYLIVFLLKQLVKEGHQAQVVKLLDEYIVLAYCNQIAQERHISLVNKDSFEFYLFSTGPKLQEVVDRNLGKVLEKGPFKTMKEAQTAIYETLSQVDFESKTTLIGLFSQAPLLQIQNYLTTISTKTNEQLEHLRFIAAYCSVNSPPGASIQYDMNLNSKEIRTEIIQRNYNQSELLDHAAHLIYLKIVTEFKLETSIVQVPKPKKNLALKAPYCYNPECYNYNKIKHHKMECWCQTLEINSDSEKISEVAPQEQPLARRNSIDLSVY